MCKTTTEILTIMVTIMLVVLTIVSCLICMCKTTIEILTTRAATNGSSRVTGTLHICYFRVVIPQRRESPISIMHGNIRLSHNSIESCQIAQAQRSTLTSRQILHYSEYNCLPSISHVIAQEDEHEGTPCAFLRNERPQ